MLQGGSKRFCVSEPPWWRPEYPKTLQRCFVHAQKPLSPEQEVILTKFFQVALPLFSYTYVNQEFTVGGLPCTKKLTQKIVPACVRRINETRPRVGEHIS